MKLEIENLLSDDFLSLFKQNLNKNLPYPIDVEYFETNTGTVEWGRAYRTTCNTLKQVELLNYLESLDWEEFDTFAWELGQIMIEKGFVD